MTNRNNIEDKWTEQLRYKMERYKMPVNDNLWGAIETKYKRKLLLFKAKRVSLVAVAVLALGLIIGLSINNETENTTINTPNITKAETHIDDSATEPSADLSASDGVADANGKGINATADNNHDTPESFAKPATESAKETEKLQTENSASDVIADDLASADEDSDTKEVPEEKDQNQPQGLTEEEFLQKYYATDREIPVIDRPKADKWSVGLYAANGLGGTGFEGDNDYFFDFFGDDESINGISNNEREISIVGARHKLPLSVGLSFRYTLGNRWSAETGLVYNLLKSDINLYDESSFMLYSGSQTLHYLGIPLKVNFDIWRHRGLGVYASAGVLMEKMIHGTQKCEATDNIDMTDWEKDVEIDNLQWSVGLAVGLECKIISDFGIYVEPGFGYYFDDGSEVDTYYDDNPLGFNLKVGLRYTR